MKLFQVVQKNFARLGISPNQSHYNRLTAISFCSYSLGTISASVFLIFDASTFLEFAMNMFVTSTMFACWFGYIVILFQKQQIFQFFDNFERFFDKSEDFPKILKLKNIKMKQMAFPVWISESENSTKKSALNETNHLVEKWCAIGAFLMIKVTPIGLVYPLAFISYATYFVTNAGSDAFVLPVLHW